MQINDNQTFNGVIIGGGPVGWLTALALVKAGYKIALVAPPASQKDQRTVALMQGALRFLKAVNLKPETIEDAAPLQSIRMIDATKRLVRAPEITFKANEIGYPFFALNIPMTGLVAHIQQAVHNHDNFVHIIDTAKSFANRAQNLALQLASDTQLTSQFVIGADGRHSFIRQAAGIACKQWSYPQTALVTSFSHSSPHHNISTEFHTESGPFTLVPLHGNRSSVVCMVKPEEAERLMALPEPELLDEFQRRSHSILGALSQLGPRQNFPISTQFALNMAQKNVFLVGESAHAIPPIGAQGLNLSIRDIEVLHQLFKTKPDLSSIPQLARQYAQKRYLDVSKHLVGIDALNRSLLADFLPLQVLRGIGLYAAKTLPFVRKILMQQGLGLSAF